MMNSQLGTTNQNWMDENNRNKIEEKLPSNILITRPEPEHPRNEDYLFKQAFSYLQPQPFFGNYDYHPSPQLYYQGNHPNDKEIQLSFQEISYQPQEIMGFTGAERDMYKLYKTDFHMNFMNPGLIPNSTEGFPLVMMSPQYLTHTQLPIGVSDKPVKLQQCFFRDYDHNSRLTDYPFKQISIPPYPPAYLFEPHQDVTPEPVDNIIIPQFHREIKDRRIRSKGNLGGITPQERNFKIQLYLEKKKRRTYVKKVSYDCRKKVADQRVRVKGRFVTKKVAAGFLKVQENEDALEKIEEQQELRQEQKQEHIEEQKQGQQIQVKEQKQEVERHS